MRNRYIMIGGFLGAGKTTAIAKLSHWLAAKDIRAGLITNDQGTGLVDTSMLKQTGLMVEEISGGCFCCRFNSLVEAADRLMERDKPDVFIAEPVGSCTDLVATVSYPLRSLYGDVYTLSPLSVLVDPIRASRMLGLMEGRQFSEKVTYIYRKQLEEADSIVINKIDLVSADDLKRLRTALETEYPNALIQEISAREEKGLEPWFDWMLQTEQAPRTIMDVDYSLYADGEALLGWLNAAFSLTSDQREEANKWLLSKAHELHDALIQNATEVAHMKMTLQPSEGIHDLAVVNLVRNDLFPEQSMTLEAPLCRGDLTLNLRAEADPEVLRSLVMRIFVEGNTSPFFLQLKDIQAFKPGKPEPTHRHRQDQSVSIN